MRSTLPELAVRPVFEGSSESAGTFAPPSALPLLHIAEYCLNFATAVVVFPCVDLFLQRTLHGVPPASSHHLLAADVLLGAIVVIMLNQAGAYKASSGLLRVRETSCVLQACVLAMLVVAPSAMLVDYRLALAFVLLAFPLLSLLLVVEKHLAHTLFDAYRRRGLGLKRVLIYGSGDVGRRLFSTLHRSPRLGLLPVAVVDPDSEIEAFADRDGSLPGMGSHQISSSMLRTYRADLVLVAGADLSRSEMRNLVRESSEADASVIFAADLVSEYSGPVSITELDGEMLYGPINTATPSFYNMISRACDLLVSSALLVFTSPLFLLVALMIRLDSDGPILFRQQRVGKNGILFTILKFRSMHVAQCGDHISPESSSDSRITRVGRILRKTSLDELPQLLNILLGEMALVGPRPEMPFIVADYTYEQRKRLAARPGLTGLWQISADRCRPIHENIHYDLYYLRNRSIYMDAAILFHTLLFAMRGV